MQRRTEKSGNLFSADALREPGIGISFKGAGNSFPKTFEGGRSHLCCCTSLPPPEEVVSEGKRLRMISGTPGPFVSLSFLLRFAAESTKASSILILAFPT